MRRIHRSAQVIPDQKLTAPIVSTLPNGHGKGHGIYDNERFPYIAEVLCRTYGMTNEQLAPVFGVTFKSFEAWITKYPDLKKGIRAGKDAYDSERVENALLKRAMGYQYVEKTTRTVRVKAKRNIDNFTVYLPAVEEIVTVKEIPADVKAIMFWLINRNSERWRMVSTVNANINAKTEHTERKLSVTADLTQMDREQLKALRDMVSTQGQDASELIAAEDSIPMLELIEKAQNILDGGETIIEDD